MLAYYKSLSAEDRAGFLFFIALLLGYIALGVWVGTRNI